ncbi:MAG: ribonuclease HII [Pseudomonadales bacterium]|nr:ribonuclease HII [Pseudomonadales bacterium]
MPRIVRQKPYFRLSRRDNPSIQLLVGIDEAGRGPLAGPVVAGAVVLNAKLPIKGLADSKKLTRMKRECLFDEIKERALAYGIGIADAREIDSLNILQASLLAMRRAYTATNVEADEVWVDGDKDPAIPAPTFTLVGGDAKMAAISAASILAKVTRDRMMEDYARSYPQYAFERHKGYPTALHLTLLRKFGPCPIHRRSFAPVRNVWRSQFVGSHE